MLLVACYKQHGTIHDATLLKATVACYKVALCMVAFIIMIQCLSNESVANYQQKVTYSKTTPTRL